MNVARRFSTKPRCRPPGGVSWGPLVDSGARELLTSEQFSTNGLPVGPGIRGALACMAGHSGFDGAGALLLK